MTRGGKVRAFIKQVYLALIFLLTFADRRPFLQAYCTLGFLVEDGVGYLHGANNSKYSQGN